MGTTRVGGLRRPLEGSYLHRELNGEETWAEASSRGNSGGLGPQWMGLVHVPAPVLSPRPVPGHHTPSASHPSNHTLLELEKTPGLRSSHLYLFTSPMCIVGHFFILFSKANFALSLNIVETPRNRHEERGLLRKTFFLNQFHFPRWDQVRPSWPSLHTKCGPPTQLGAS